jgi:hypothetical protein
VTTTTLVLWNECATPALEKAGSMQARGLHSPLTNQEARVAMKRIGLVGWSGVGAAAVVGAGALMLAMRRRSRRQELQRMTALVVSTPLAASALAAAVYGGRALARRYRTGETEGASDAQEATPTSSPTPSTRAETTPAAHVQPVEGTRDVDLSAALVGAPVH